jgi:hypothetical protein
MAAIFPALSYENFFPFTIGILFLIFIFVGCGYIWVDWLGKNPIGIRIFI